MAGWILIIVWETLFIAILIGDADLGYAEWDSSETQSVINFDLHTLMICILGYQPRIVFNYVGLPLAVGISRLTDVVLASVVDYIKNPLLPIFNAEVSCSRKLQVSESAPMNDI